MKKRKHVIFSVIVCLVSVCLLTIGGCTPDPQEKIVSISGQVSYTTHDEKVLVQGKVSGAKDQAAVDYPTATISANTVTATKVTNMQTQYLDYIAGSENSEQNVLSPWNIGTLEFCKDSTGLKDITISFKLTNLSACSVKVTLTFPTGATAGDLENAKISRTASTKSTFLTPNGGNKEITVTYKLSDNVQTSQTHKNVLGMNICFENINYQKNSISVINGNGGKVTMGKQSSTSTIEDVQWKCFTYSMDGNTWTKLDSGQSIPSNAKYGYFVLETYVSNMDNQAFLAEGKYTKNTENGTYYTNAGVNGVTESNTVFANDYYYSDIRQTMKSIETMLDISSDNEIYRSIQGRTISDLYSAIKLFGEERALPKNANANDQDKFWLMSVDEIYNYFSDAAARKWLNGNSGTYYWLRSPDSDSFDDAYRILNDGGISNQGGILGYVAARPAFKLALA